jgi:hypothetical protein
LAITVLVLLAFARTYYLKEFHPAPPLTPLMHAHAATFTAWVLLFVVQAYLVATRRVGLHRTLGLAGAVLLVLMSVLALAAVFEAGRRGVPRGALSAGEQMAIPLAGLVLFSGFAAAGITLRHRPELHKPLMFLALLGMLGPAIGRLATGIGAQLLVLGIALGWAMTRDYLQSRRVPVVLLGGGLLLVASWPFRYLLARSQAWEACARWLLDNT